MRILDMIAWLLLIIGGLNWGLVGVFNYNVVEAIFQAGSTATMVVYALIGLAAVYSIFRKCACCKSGCKM